MFKAISLFTKLGTVKLVLKEHSTGIRVDVLFNAKEDSQNISPFSVIGSAESCEAELVEIFNSLQSSCSNDINTIATIQGQLKKKADEALDKAKGKTPAKGVKKEAEPKKKEPSLFAQPKPTPEADLKEKIVEKTGIPKDNIIVGSPKPIAESPKEKIIDSLNDPKVAEKIQVEEIPTIFDEVKPKEEEKFFDKDSTYTLGDNTITKEPKEEEKVPTCHKCNLPRTSVKANECIYPGCPDGKYKGTPAPKNLNPNDVPEWAQQVEEEYGVKPEVEQPDMTEDDLKAQSNFIEDALEPDDSFLDDGYANMFGNNQ